MKIWKIKWIFILLAVVLGKNNEQEFMPRFSKTKLDGVITQTVWCGKENEVILLQTDQNSVYRSEDRGAHFKKITKKIQRAAEEKLDNTEEIGQVVQITRTGKDEKGVLFMGTHGIAWFSSNCGKTMIVIKHNSVVERIKGHQTEDGWYLAQINTCKNQKQCDHKHRALAVTFNYGRNWKPLLSSFSQWEWARAPMQIDAGIPKNRIYAFVKKSDSSTLVYSDNWFKSSTNLVDDCVHFVLRHSFMFALKKTTKNKVKIMVSNLESKFQNFTYVQMPEKLQSLKDIKILDTSENAAFIMINHDNNNEFGDIYVSDSTGVRYSLSLKNVARHPSKGADFVKVKGIEGVFIANVLDKSALKQISQYSQESEEEEWENEEDEYKESKGKVSKARSRRINYLKSLRVHTVITFNKGGSWRYLRPPKFSANKKPVRCGQIKKRGYKVLDKLSRIIITIISKRELNSKGSILGYKHINMLQLILVIIFFAIIIVVKFEQRVIGAKKFGLQQWDKSCKKIFNKLQQLIMTRNIIDKKRGGYSNNKNKRQVLLIFKSEMNIKKSQEKQICLIKIARLHLKLINEQDR